MNWSFKDTGYIIGKGSCAGAYQEFKIDTAEGMKDLLNKTFFQLGARKRLPLGINSNEGNRGCEGSLTILPAFLCTETIYSSDKGACWIPTILLALLIILDNITLSF